MALAARPCFSTHKPIAAAASPGGAVTVMQLVRECEGKALHPLGDIFDPDDTPALECDCRSLEGQNLPAKESAPGRHVRYATRLLARLGGGTGYYGKPGPIVSPRGVAWFHAIKHGWNLQHV
ncbi:MAG: hypothetical protein L0Y57_14765 [Beijerinckiaceae bacterium]|nr:hypothetical protein [Beijerinckiaceae bacterium]